MNEFCRALESTASPIEIILENRKMSLAVWSIDRLNQENQDLKLHHSFDSMACSEFLLFTSVLVDCFKKDHELCDFDVFGLFLYRFNFELIPTLFNYYHRKRKSPNLINYFFKGDFKLELSPKFSNMLKGNTENLF